MKRIVIFIVLVALVLVGLISTDKSDEILSKNVEKKVQISDKTDKSSTKSKEKNDEKSKENNITTPSVSQNDDKIEENSSQEIQKTIQNDTNVTSNSTQTTPSSSVVSESSSQNNTQQNIVQEEQPQVDPSTPDTSHYLYAVHHGIVTRESYSECQNAGYSVQRTYPDKNLSNSCYEVYNISGGINGYFLDITEDGRDANYLKASLNLR
ncbi:MAG: hypothetical protein J6M39_04785 [Lachnospiraceae bacterium]|nr:hypothetical protein [Lachnospiraceae bacterium]